MKILIVGNPASFHVGHHFFSATQELGIAAEILDSSHAYGKGLWQKVAWRWDRSPSKRGYFEKLFEDAIERQRPDLVLVTGIAPLGGKTLRRVARSGVQLVNFLTDDPWNPVHRCHWFIEAMSEYRCIFTPRKSNINDLLRIQSQVFYLPFAYNPQLHFVEGSPEIDCDILFVGGADRDRLPYTTALAKQGLKVWVFGGYWDRYANGKLRVMGHADLPTIRRVTAAAKMNLILVRRANRDGHVMRTFEAAACGGCLLVEDTEEHREIFGETVSYFTDSKSLTTCARVLIEDKNLRETRVRDMGYRISLSGQHTYRARLETMFQHLDLREKAHW